VTRGVADSLMSTGSPGLDLVLGGGLERGGVVALAGAPGTGKTILAQQVCFANATPEHKAVYYTTMSEPHTKLVRHLEAFSFFHPAALGVTVEHIHLGDFLRPPAEGADGLAPIVSEIVRKTLEEEPAVVAIDSTKMLRDFASEHELRNALYDLTGRVADTGTVLLMLGQYTPEELESGTEFSLADAIIQLEYQSREPVDRRSVRVTKARGTSQRPGRHTFQIGPHGVEVYPRIETLLPHRLEAVSGRARTGIPGLDDLMDGGPKAGDATLVTGPSGIGKTIFALRWLAAALEQGARCLYVTFQDTPDELVAMATTFGWDLGIARAAGRLTILYVPMGNLDLDVLASAIRAELEAQPVGRVAIDSLAEMIFAVREAERFPAFLRSLIGLIRASGASSLVTSETPPHGVADNSLTPLMFLFHNIIDLRYIEYGSRVGRAISVLKMRNSRHEMTLSCYTISDHGITVGEKLEGVSGRLGWSVLTDRGRPG
jgi:circadian clock protein KaiC